MQYNSWLYLLAFLGVTVLCYYLAPLRLRWTVLLGASAVFYWISCGWLLCVLPLTALGVYLLALRMERVKESGRAAAAALPREERRLLRERTQRQTGRLLALTAAGAFGVLFFTKYFNFAAVNLNALLAALRVPARIPGLHLLMPLGISFYTLSAVSYAADVAHGVCPAQRNYGKLLAFLLFFPVITEGPVSRYGQLAPQISRGNRFDCRTFAFGVQLILWGLFQKVVLADRLDRYVGNIFDHYRSYSGIVTALTAVLYTFQIYMDFSGCVDIARGSAELFGIHLAENFRRPFFANSVNDFWRRWHITLGAWLRDYIFYPLSMSRGFQRLSRWSRKYLGAYYAAAVPALFALLAVWLGNGIWHGAAWKYIVYGLYYYAITALGMLLEPVFLRLLPALGLSREQRGYRIFQILRTFVLVNVGMVIFRADSLPAAAFMLRSVFRPYRGGSLAGVLAAQGLPLGQAAIAAAGAAVVFAVSLLRERGVCLREAVARRPIPVRWAVYFAALLAVLIAGAYGPGFGSVDFIYAQF
ncbi:MAG: MBOAT family protein [Oscillibacter sp.]|jgi:D-alanyl-lipoteichoic acid acyltransferase DltB (MBOAT superfamily)|nr:MBOAT family protein [Oscillibacter sp.]